MNEQLDRPTPGLDWPAHGCTYGEPHFSPLNQVNEQTVGDLRLALYMDLDSGNAATAPLRWSKSMG